MRIMLEEYAFMPLRGHETDAGLDLRAPYDVWLDGRSYTIIDTGVHVELPRWTAGMLKSKSGLNVKHGITSDGVVDYGYTGSIVVKLYNHSDFAYKITAGDRITQLVIVPVIIPDLEVVKSLEETERGANGFGSTGK